MAPFADVDRKLLISKLEKTSIENNKNNSNSSVSNMYYLNTTHMYKITYTHTDNLAQFICVCVCVVVVVKVVNDIKSVYVILCENYL